MLVFLEPGAGHCWEVLAVTDSTASKATAAGFTYFPAQGLPRGWNRHLPGRAGGGIDRASATLSPDKDDSVPVLSEGPAASAGGLGPLSPLRGVT